MAAYTAIRAWRCWSGRAVEVGDGYRVFYTVAVWEEMSKQLIEVQQ